MEDKGNKVPPVAVRLQYDEKSLRKCRLFYRIYGGSILANPRRLVPRVRLERTTYALGERCSIHLSYWGL